MVFQTRPICHSVTSEFKGEVSKTLKQPRSLLRKFTIIRVFIILGFLILVSSTIYYEPRLQTFLSWNLQGQIAFNGTKLRDNEQVIPNSSHAQQENKSRPFFPQAQNFSIPTTSSANIWTDGTDIPYCGHSLVIAGPRHGSTWLVNNIENCSYSQSDGTFGNLHDKSELWIPRPQNLVSNISVYQAEKYISHNSSLKLFPWPWRAFKNDSERLLQYCVKHKIPIVLLGRDVRQAFRSMVLARETNRWNDNNIRNTLIFNSSLIENVEQTVAEKIKLRTNDWVTFNSQMKQHALSVANYLDKNNFSFDRVAYDSFVKEKEIVLPNSHCKIRNCNYVRP